MLKIEGDIPFLKKVKFKDVCMAGWQLPAIQTSVNVVNLKASFEIGFQPFSFSHVN